MIITIDGPTASGKSSVARLLAQRLGYYYISSGLLFRGLAYALVQIGYDQKKIEHPNDNDIRALSDRFEYRYVAGAEHLLYNKEDITIFLRTEQISHYASLLALNLTVRNVLTVWQRKLAACHDCVVEGRDTGSVIFPDADIKFFLTASLDERARRWQKDRSKDGISIAFEQALHDVKNRDERDITRNVAPLCIPHGAIFIDDTALSKEAVVARMLQEINKIIS